MNQRWWQWQRGGTLFLWSAWIWEKAVFSLQSRIQTVWFHLKFKTLLLVLEVRTAARWRMGVSVLLGLSEWLGLAFARCLRLVRILMEHILCINLRTTWKMSPFDCKWQKSELKLAHVLQDVYKDAKEHGAGLMNSGPPSTNIASTLASRACFLQGNRYWWKAVLFMYSGICAADLLCLLMNLFM